MTLIATFYNQEQWVDVALDSVVGQTEPEFQLLIADDGSSDGTRERILAWRDRHDQLGELVFAEQNGGLPALLNLSLPLIRGSYVVVLNGDDWLDPPRLQRQADEFDRLPDTVGVVYSDLRVMDVDGIPTGEIFPSLDQDRPEGQLLHRVIAAPLIGMPCIMFRQSILETIGPWDETLVADDFDFVLRVAAADFEFAYLPVIDTNYRQHGSSLTGSRNGVLADGRIAALNKMRGKDSRTDELIDERISGLAIALHSLGYDRSITRRRLRQSLCRRPGRRLLRATVESHLRIKPGRLSLKSWTSENVARG